MKRTAAFTLIELPAVRRRGFTLIELPAVRRRGFTLIELLVVVAIIVALLAILMPSLGRAVDAATMAKCGAQLHVNGQGMLEYAADNRGDLPYQSGDLVEWLQPATRNALDRYYSKVGDVWYCPSIEPIGKIAEAAWGNILPDGDATYFWNNLPPGYPTYYITYYLLTNFSHENHVVDVDGDGDKREHYLRSLRDPHPASTAIVADTMVQSPPSAWTFRHSPTDSRRGRNQALYGDGHVEARGVDQIIWRYVNAPQYAVGW